MSNANSRSEWSNVRVVVVAVAVILAALAIGARMREDGVKWESRIGYAIEERQELIEKMRQLHGSDMAVRPTNVP